MNVKKVKEIVKFDIEKSIQNKWFVILNVVMFIGILIATNWSNISKFLEDNNISILTEDEVSIQILDKDNLFYDDFVEKYKEFENFKIEKVEKNEYSKDNVPEDNTVLVEIKRDDKKIIAVKIVSKEAIDDSIYQAIYDSLMETRSKVFAEDNGITLEQLNILNEEIDVEREMLGVNVENSETKEIIKMFSIIIVYMVLLIVLGRIANEIAQEKVSKSIEYVLTSVSEKEYLLAKVLSATLTILIQLLYTFVYYVIGNMVSSLFTDASLSTAAVSAIGIVDTSVISYVLAMCAYLVFTVFLMTLIQAALSAKTTSVSEAGNTTMLLVMVVVILYVVSLGAISPYTKVSTFMYIISCLPIVSTFFVPSMMIIGQSTTLQIIISFVLLILSVPLLFNICAKHFKNGILDYTSSKKKKGLFRKSEKKELGLREKQDYELRKTKAKKYAFIIGMAMILLFFLETVTSFIFALVIPSVLADKVSIGTMMMIENTLCLIISLSLTAAFIKFYSPTVEKENNKTLSGKIIFEIIFMGIAVIALIQLVLNLIYPKIGLDYNIFDSVNMIPDNGFWGNILLVFGLALVPAIFEELLFRKWILNISKKYGLLFAVIFSSLLFGLYHMNLNQAIFAFLIGILFGIIAIKTGSIKLTVLLHFLNNLYACILTILEEGTVAYSMFNNIVIALAIFGGVILLKNLPKLKEVKKENFKLNEDSKFLLRNYTFLVSMILLIVTIIATDNMLK